jgi:hypothetical protein
MDVGNQVVERNGEEIAIKDIPSAFERALHGYGHFPGHGRQVVDAPEMNWPHTPVTCPTDEVINRWLFAGTDEVLVCMGCGLDVT